MASLMDNGPEPNSLSLLETLLNDLSSKRYDMSMHSCGANLASTSKVAGFIGQVGDFMGRIMYRVWDTQTRARPAIKAMSGKIVKQPAWLLLIAFVIGFFGYRLLLASN